VLKPALIFNGPIAETFQHFTTFLFGIYLFTSAIEGYYRGINLTITNYLLLRITIAITGALLIFPEKYTDLMGIICFFIIWRGTAYHLKRIFQK
jgi:TRAP-type uncharacterized transport system fused permease subunit